MIKTIFALLVISGMVGAATRTWSSASSTDMNLATNYSGSGALLTTDDLVFNNTSVVNATASANLDVASVTIASNYTGAWSISGRELICETGNFSDDGITGGHNYGNKITLNGASATMHIGSGIVNNVATSCQLVFNGTTGAVLDDDKGITARSLTLGSGANLTLGGSGNISLSGAAPLLVFTNGGTLVDNQPITVIASSSGKFINIISGTPTITGNSTVVFSTAGSSAMDTVPGLTFGGTVSVRIDNGSGGNGCTTVLSGHLSAAGSIDIRNLRNSTTFRFVNPSYNITCGALNTGASVGTSRSITCKYGSGTYTVASFGNTLDGAGMTQIDSMESSVWNCSGSWTFGTYHTIIPGTSKVAFSGATKSIITAIDSTKQFYDMEFAKTAAAVCTLSGTTYLKCNEFRATSGKIYIPCSLSCNSYLNLTTDTIFIPKNKYVSTSFYRASTAISKADTANTYFTGTGRHDISSDTGYTMGKFRILAGVANWLTGAKLKLYTLLAGSKSTHVSGKLFAIDSVYDIEGSSGAPDTVCSATPESRFTLRLPAPDTVSYTAFRDCSSSVVIKMDNTCQDLGNNRNISFLSKTVTLINGDSVRLSAINGLSFETGATCSLSVACTTGCVWRWNGSPWQTVLRDTLLIVVGGDTTITAESRVNSANYYVATTGSDAAAGSIGAPWATVAHGCSTVVAGDTLFIRGGVYHEHGISVTNSGNSDNQRIVITSFPGERAIVNADSSGDGFQIGLTSNRYINLENITIKFGLTHGIVLEQEAQYITIKNCQVDSTKQYDNSGGIAIRYARNIKILNCTVVGNNSTSNDNYAGIFIYGQDGSVEIMGCNVSQAANGILYKYPSNRTVVGKITNNFVHHNRNCGINVNSDRIVIKNNLIVKNAIGGIFLRGDPGTRGGSDCLIEHNTLYGSPYTSALVWTGNPSTYGPAYLGATYDTMKNNLLIGNNGEKGSFSIWMYFNGTDSNHNTSSNYNNYYNTATTNVLQEFNNYYTLAQWKTRYPTQDLNSTILAPIFSNPSGTMNEIEDFELTGGGGYLAGSDGKSMGADIDSVLYNYDAENEVLPTYTRAVTLIGGHGTLSYVPSTLSPVDSAAACTTSVGSITTGYQCDSIVSIRDGTRNKVTGVTRITYSIAANAVDTAWVSLIQPKNYYVRADGTAPKSAAIGPNSSQSACMSMATFNASSFIRGDSVFFTSRGGSFAEGMIIPSSYIVYISTDSATIDVSSNASNIKCVYNSGKDSIMLIGLWAKGGGGAQAFRFEGGVSSAQSGVAIDCHVVSNYGAADAGNQHDGFSIDGRMTMLFRNCTANGCRESSAPFIGSHQGVTAHGKSKFTWIGGKISDCNFCCLNVDTAHCKIDSCILMSPRILAISAGTACTLTVSHSTISANGVGVFGCDTNATLNIDSSTIIDSAGIACTPKGKINFTCDTINQNISATTTGLITNFVKTISFVRCVINVSGKVAAQGFIFNPLAGSKIIMDGNTVNIPAPASTLPFIYNNSSASVKIDIRRNLFFSDSARFIGYYAQIDTAIITGNLFSSKYQTIFIRQYDNSTGIYKYYRNTFYSPTSSGKTAIYIGSRTSGSTSIVGNIFNNIQTSFATANVTTISNNDYYNSTNAGGTGSITTNPAFTNNVTCTIDKSSPCYSTGVDVGISSDAYGKAIPNQQGGYSMGYNEPHTTAFAVTLVNGDSVRLSTINGTSFQPGETCSLSVACTTGCVWRWNGSPWYSVLRDTLLIVVGGDTTVTAESRVIPEYTIDTTIVGSGIVIITNGLSRDSGSAISYVITPSDGWSYTGVTGTLVSTSNPANYIITENHIDTITFTEVINPYNLTVNHTGNGSTSPSGLVVVNEGVSTSITATGTDSSHFIIWSITSGTPSIVDITDATTNITLDEDATINAVFGPDTFVCISNGTAQAVITYQTDSIASYGQTIRAYLNVTSGYIASWPGGSGIVSRDTLDIRMYKDSTITVLSHSIPDYTISETIVGLGDITYNPSSTVDSGQNIICTAVATNGYIFTGWSRDTTSTTNPISIYMGSNKSLTATFRLIPIIDSSRCHVRRDLRWNVVRQLDTITLYFTTDIGDSTASSSVWINRGMTIVSPITRWFNTAGRDSVWCIVPSGTPLNYYYRSMIRSGLGVLSNEPSTHILFVKGQVR